MGTIGRTVTDDLGRRISKISLFGNFGTLNIGNECTLQAIIHNIRRYLPGAEMNCICPDPGDVSARHGIEAVPMSTRAAAKGPEGPPGIRRPLLARLLRVLFVLVPGELREAARMLRVLKGRDMLIMTGTGMLTDYGEGPLGLPYEIFKWTIAARIRGLKVLFVSVGVEPIERKLTRVFVKASLRLAEFISYRDRQSMGYLTSLGFGGRGAVFPDLAFSLPETLVPPRRETRAGKSVVGIGLFDHCERGVSGPGEAEQYREYLEKIGSFAVRLTSDGHPVRILIGDLQYDNPVRADLRSWFESRGLDYEERGITDEPVATVAALFEQIGKTDIVVASRFHNVLLALMLGKPVISLSYNVKNDALMAETGQLAYCKPIEDFSLAWLLERLSEIERDDGLGERIKQRTAEYRRILEDQYRLIFGRGGRPD